jgi:hypothetical protein
MMMAERKLHRFDDLELVKLLSKLTVFRAEITHFLLSDTTRRGDTRWKELHQQALYAEERQYETDCILADMFEAGASSIPQASYEAIQQHVAVIEDCAAMMAECDRQDCQGIPRTAKDDDQDYEQDDDEGDEWKTR